MYRSKFKNKKTKIKLTHTSVVNYGRIFDDNT